MDTHSVLYDSTAQSWVGLVKAVLQEHVAVGQNTRSDHSNDKDTMEWTNATLAFVNPVFRVIDPPGRKLNLPFAVLDAFEMLTGGNGAGSADWNKWMAKFRAPDGSVPGSYGRRIKFSPRMGLSNGVYGVDQYVRAFEELQDHPDTRRAVVVVNNPYYEDFQGNNVACTLSLQYLNRGGALHCIATMRSNDLYKGFCYDTFAFQLFQELMARALRLRLGRYWHNAASLHLYEEDRAKLAKIGEGSVYEHFPSVKIRNAIDLYMATATMSHVAMIPRLTDATRSKVIEEAWALDEYLGNCASLVAAESCRRAGDFDGEDRHSAMITNEFRNYYSRRAAP